MSSYKTTVTSGSQSTVTFASFGLYELEDGDNWSYEIDIDARTALTTRVSSREEVQTNASPTQATALPLQRSEVPKPHTDPPVTQPPAHASRLVKKILARPPSLSGPPGPPIPMTFVTLASIDGDTDSVDAENMSSDESSSSDSGRSTEGTSSGSTNPTSVPEDRESSELNEPVLRPLTVPPWNRKMRRANVCATTVDSNSEYCPPPIVSDGPMRFPF
ncbi:hypothetical protein BT96DRAFT_918460 [Gymnopus androsaceus JB14]|uniref:Uncharacterized protein n=1 Tax=Gymnopus androsaceus JB14 TaxID=1447944 RepID=A0A6A4HZF9_9AGAR|nr:hypothetical protein BT96DRAFT_918460 [Gymnopus androsaceus JB14]